MRRSPTSRSFRFAPLRVRRHCALRRRTGSTLTQDAELKDDHCNGAGTIRLFAFAGARFVLNRVARSVVEGMRGQHPEYVFVYRGWPIGTLHGRGSRLGNGQVCRR
jgi:hypothetical protein